MATVAVTSSETIASVPWLVRKLTCTTGTTAAALTHGGPAATPDMYFFTSTNSSGTVGGEDLAVTAKSTTTITVDCEDDGNDTFELFLIWFDQSAGGIS